ncbi:GDSL esterase/lipase At5g08460 [Beta vulgaris subsp. vulgaris]|uniref:GDSL esterase/lipase At5g08460 n=1 Tax=Beta vulgaris subsp. vulgaris TaxID=3555 RepID=UPI002036E1D5|nr:GDSL esterase/lipase At5g08460 [Beta vulgaris subsp. vulgaris]
MSLRNCLYIIFLCFISFACLCNAKKPKNGGGFKGMFIFGTSIFDNGNNNNIIGTLAKANYPPYGVDFAAGVTGRFSNGKNVADVIGDYLKLPLIPAFADPQTKGDAILHGVNFASGGSGILDETGLVVGRVIPLNEQIRNFEGVTLPELERQLRCQRTEILVDYLFLIGAGNNDYLLNYFLLGPMGQSPQAFAQRLISTYSDQLKKLYNLGARNFLLLSVYPLGCSPVVSRGQGCLPGPNAVVSIFYDQLISMVNQIKSQMPGSEILVLNSVKIMTDIINNPGLAGLSNVSNPCCEVSSNGLSCIPNGNICANRNNYAYFDGQHITESFSTIIATKAYTSSDPSEVYPFNLCELVHAHL